MGSFQKIVKPTRARGLDTSSGEQIVGNQLLEDPSFDVNVAGGASGLHWACDVTGNDGLSITGGKAVWADSASGDDRRLQDQSDGPFTDVTARYRVTVVISDYTDGALKFVSGSYNSGYNISGVGTHVIDMSPLSGGGNFHLDGNAAADLSVSEVSCYKLESFPNNNHAQIHSGRALEFDGVTDYLVADSVAALADSDFTAAIWIKPTLDGYTGGPGGRVLFSFHDGSNNNRLIVFIAGSINGTLKTYTNSGLNSGNTNTPLTGSWERIVLVKQGNSIQTYRNGVADGIITMADTISGSAKFSIGQEWDGSTASDFYLGMMSDFQIWNSVWTAADAEYDYLNPEQLVLNRGGTSLTNSNLKLWYPMNEGHRGNQSYVLDASNTGLGDNVLLNGTFDTDLSQWTVLNNTGDNNVTWVNGKARLLYDPAIATTSLGISTSAQPDPMTAGVNYKVTFDLVATSGELKFYDGANYTTGLGTGSYVVYFKAAAADIQFNRNSSGQATDVTIDNVKIYPVNAKHNATTVFYGDELVTNGDMELDDNWNDQSSPTTNERSSTRANGDSTYSRKAVGDSTGDGLKSDTFSLVAGRTYKVEFYYFLETGSNNLLARLQDGDGNDLSTSESLTTKNAWTKVTFSRVVETSGSASYFKIYQNGSGSSTFYLDDVTVKEVGTAMGWTDADQQLDISQTAFQSYNQLAWPHGASNHQVNMADGDSDMKFTTGDFTISFWIMPNSNTLDGYVLSKGAYNTSGYYIYYDGSTRKVYYQTNQSSAGQANNSSALTLGKWHHCVVAINDSGTDSQWYINGEVDVEKVNHTAPTADTRNLQLYNRGGGSGNANFGLTELSFWNKTLSQAEVTEIYNDGLALDATTHSASSDLLHYWRNNGLGTWTDIGNAGSLYNGTPANITQSMLITAGEDSSRDSQGFLMNRQRLTNSLNLNTNTIADGIDNGDRAIVSGGTDLGTADFSVSFWAYKFQDWKDQWVVSQYIDTNNRWYIRANESNPPRFHIFGKSGGNVIFNITDSSTNLDSYLNTWVHVVCTVDRDGSVKIYFNGSEIKSAAVESGQHSTSLTFASDLIIGQNGDTSFDDHHFDGKIDDLLIYSDKLEAPEVTRIYKAGKRSHR